MLTFSQDIHSCFSRIFRLHSGGILGHVRISSLREEIHITHRLNGNLYVNPLSVKRGHPLSLLGVFPLDPLYRSKWREHLVLGTVSLAHRMLMQSEAETDLAGLAVRGKLSTLGAFRASLPPIVQECRSIFFGG